MTRKRYVNDRRGRDWVVNMKEELNAINKGLEFCRQLGVLEDEFVEKMGNKELWQELKDDVDNMNEEGI